MSQNIWKPGLVLLAMVVMSYGQGVRMNSPTRVMVRFIITVDGETEKARQAKIELSDELSSGFAAQVYTDNNGEASLPSMSGVHQVHISGPGIKPYQGEFEISPNEMAHLERIRVQRDPGYQTTPVSPNAPIAAVRLRIPDAARKTFDKGSQALSKQHWDEARTLFQKAVEQYSDYDMAYNGMGVADMQLKDSEAAKQVFAKAIALNPRYAEAQRNLARIFISEHNNVEALPLLKASLEGESSDVWALSNVAYLQLQGHNFEEALAFAQKVHSLPHQNMPYAHMVAAYAAEGLGKNDVAEKELHLYLDEDPKGPNVARAQQELSRLEAGSKK